MGLGLGLGAAVREAQRLNAVVRAVGDKGGCHQGAIRELSGSHQRAIREPSGSHQRAIGVSTCTRWLERSATKKLKPSGKKQSPWGW